MKVDINDPGIDLSNVEVDPDDHTLSGEVDIRLCDLHSELRKYYSVDDVLSIWEPIEVLDAALDDSNHHVDERVVEYCQNEQLLPPLDSEAIHRLKEIKHWLDNDSCSTDKAIEEIKFQLAQIQKMIDAWSP